MLLIRLGTLATHKLINLELGNALGLSSAFESIRKPSDDVGTV